MDSLSLPVLVVIFLMAAAVVWWAGVTLSNTTDVLDRRFGWGDALGGLVLRIEPIAVLIVLVWFGGLHVVRRANAGLVWRLDEPSDAPTRNPQQQNPDDGRSIARTVWLFTGAAGLTLLGGVVLERTSDAIAADLGIGSAVFGATVLAAATSIPEIATGIEAVRLGDHQLAISDIFGGNAFLPTLFLLMGVLSGQTVIASLGSIDIYLAALGIIVTCLYLVGLVFRSHHTIARMGYDSLLVIVVYGAGVLALILVAS